MESSTSNFFCLLCFRTLEGMIQAFWCTFLGEQGFSDSGPIWRVYPSPCPHFWSWSCRDSGHLPHPTVTAQELYRTSHQLICHPRQNCPAQKTSFPQCHVRPSLKWGCNSQHPVLGVTDIIQKHPKCPCCF